MTIKGRNKYKELKNIADYARLGIVFFVGVSITILSWILSENILITTTLGICSLIAITIFQTPPREMEIITTKNGLVINDISILYEDISFWAMVSLDDIIEFVVKTDSKNERFIYFYIDKKEEEINNLIQTFISNIPYSEEAPKGDLLNIFLRKVGLR